MSSGASGHRWTDKVIPFGPKLNGKSEAVMSLTEQATRILGVLRQAVGASEAKYQKAVETTHKSSAQLRSVEDRIKELEARVWQRFAHISPASQ